MGVLPLSNRSFRPTKQKKILPIAPSSKAGALGLVALVMLVMLAALVVLVVLVVLAALVVLVLRPRPIGGGSWRPIVLLLIFNQSSRLITPLPGSNLL